MPATPRPPTSGGAGGTRPVRPGTAGATITSKADDSRWGRVDEAHPRMESQEASGKNYGQAPDEDQKNERSSSLKGSHGSKQRPQSFGSHKSKKYPMSGGATAPSGKQGNGGKASDSQSHWQNLLWGDSGSNAAQAMAKALLVVQQSTSWPESAMRLAVALSQMFPVDGCRIFHSMSAHGVDSLSIIGSFGPETTIKKLNPSFRPGEPPPSCRFIGATAKAARGGDNVRCLVGDTMVSMDVDLQSYKNSPQQHEVLSVPVRFPSGRSMVATVFGTPLNVEQRQLIQAIVGVCCRHIDTLRVADEQRSQQECAQAVSQAQSHLEALSHPPSLLQPDEEKSSTHASANQVNFVLPVDDHNSAEFDDADGQTSIGDIVCVATDYAKRACKAEGVVMYLVDTRSAALHTWVRSDQDSDTPDDVHDSDSDNSVSFDCEHVRRPLPKGLSESLRRERPIFSTDCANDERFNISDMLPIYMTPSSATSKSKSADKSKAKDFETASTVFVPIPMSAGSSDAAISDAINSLAGHGSGRPKHGSSRRDRCVVAVMQAFNKHGGPSAVGLADGSFDDEDARRLTIIGQAAMHAISQRSVLARQHQLDCLLSQACETSDHDVAARKLAEAAVVGLGADWAVIYQVSSTGSFIWHGPPEFAKQFDSSSSAMSASSRQGDLSALVGEAPIGRMVNASTVPSLSPKAMSSSRGSMRILRHGSVDFEDKRIRRVKGVVDKGTFPLQEAIQSKSVMHLAETTSEMRLLPSEFDSKIIPGTKAETLMVAPCFDARGNPRAVIVAANKRFGGWSRVAHAQFTPSDALRLKSIACYGGNLLAQCEIERSFASQQSRWHQLLEICQAAAAQRDPSHLIELVNHMAPSVVGCQRAVLLFRVPRTDLLWTLVDPQFFEDKQGNNAAAKGANSGMFAARRSRKQTTFDSLHDSDRDSVSSNGPDAEMDNPFLNQGANVSSDSNRLEKLNDRVSKIMQSEANCGIKEVQVRFHQCIAGVAARTCRIISLSDPQEITSLFNPLTDGVSSKGFQQMQSAQGTTSKNQSQGSSGNTETGKPLPPQHIMAVPILGSRGAVTEVVAVLQCMNVVKVPVLEHTMNARDGVAIPAVPSADKAWRTLARHNRLSLDSPPMKFITSLKVGASNEVAIAHGMGTNDAQHPSTQRMAATKPGIEGVDSDDDEDFAPLSGNGFKGWDAAVVNYIGASVAAGLEHGVALQRRFAVEDELREIIDSFGRAMRAGQQITGSVDESTLFCLLGQQVRALIHATQLTVYIVASKSDMSVFRLAGTNFTEINKRRVPISGICGSVLKSGEPINVINARNHPNFKSSVDERPHIPLASLLAWPIRDPSGRVIGVLAAGNKTNARKTGSSSADGKHPGSLSVEDWMLVDEQDDLAIAEGEEAASQLAIDRAALSWERFTERDEKLVEVIAGHLGVALLNLRRYQRFQGLHDSLKELNSELNLPRAMTKIGQVIATVCGAELATLFVLDSKEGQLWAYETTDTGTASSSPNLMVAIGEGVAGTCAASGQIVNITDLSQRMDLLASIPKHTEASGSAKESTASESPARVNSLARSKSFLRAGSKISGNSAAARWKYVKNMLAVKNALAVPVKDSAGNVFAVIQVTNKSTGPFDGDDETLLRVFSAHAALTLHNCKMFEQAILDLEKTRLVLKASSKVLQCQDEHKLGLQATITAESVLEAREAILFISDSQGRDTWMRYDSAGEVKHSRFNGIAAHVVSSGDMVNTSEGSQSRGVEAGEDLSGTIKKRNVNHSHPTKKPGGAGSQGQSSAPNAEGSNTVAVPHVLCVPLLWRGSQVLGALQVEGTPDSAGWSVDDEDLCKALTDVITLALTRIRSNAGVAGLASEDDTLRSSSKSTPRTQATSPQSNVSSM